ncbi:MULTISPECIES: hypothetical protein [Micromonospora]|uniref:Uncharacterized protein n=1 Tax=Micromonospora sicca TaxID=2202420 RepID=A0ABU5JE88_9ACTN|nr:MULTISPECIES: hypothetical protein [unclassified Micromonospora]MBM0227306.1 hypothetical protein [Micromonospora sp. ATA51]MDZ5445206.1 hypothetical protein [Micromonospora sp. 4G57]MDZ5490917.1 hypothetical protein [Micromonospora sp. 4G53]
MTTAVVEHRGRLARFGVQGSSCALAATGRRIVVLDEAEVADELVEDVVDAVTSCCVRMYGCGSAAR